MRVSGILLVFFLLMFGFAAFNPVFADNVIRVGLTDNKFQNVLKQQVTVYGTADCEICDKETRKPIVSVPADTEMTINNGVMGLDLIINGKVGTLRDFVIVCPQGVLGVKIHDLPLFYERSHRVLQILQILYRRSHGQKSARFEDAPRPAPFQKIVRTRMKSPVTAERQLYEQRIQLMRVIAHRDRPALFDRAQILFPLHLESVAEKGINGAEHLYRGYEKKPPQPLAERFGQITVSLSDLPRVERAVLVVEVAVELPRPLVFEFLFPVIFRHASHSPKKMSCFSITYYNIRRKKIQC